TTDPSLSGSSAGSASNSSAQVPASSSSSNPSGYKDGTYTGPTVDVNYGLVQVQTTIQNGKVAQVTFLQYPSDRRTSQRINSIAMPYLQQEAIQAQSANVDIISGATLTSEGFQMSLQSALASAH
ncbi:MAG TPA: FMN-binding protein, partial [Anaerolineales bacterium]